MTEREEAERLLRLYAEASGASGHEGAVRRLFLEELRQVDACDFESDRSGCVLAEGKANTGPRVMVTAHMDEVGFMVQHITKEGFIQFVPLGGWWSHTVMAQGVTVVTSSGTPIPGCVASTPPHQLSEGARNQVMPLDQMYIDVGAESREEAMETFGIQLGDPIVPSTSFQKLAHSDRFMAKAFDNRVGMALLTQAMKRLSTHDLTNQCVGVATVQEELGCRGARTAAELARPDVAIVLEGPPADDAPGMNRDASQGTLGGGAQIRVMDPRALSSRPLVDFVIAQAEKADIAHQVTVRRGGGTDASSFQAHGLGVPSVVIGVPTRYIHSHHSIMDIRDYLEALKLVEAVVQGLGQAEVDGLTDFLGKGPE